MARLMRDNELAARRKKAFRPRTTLAGERIAPNLIKDLEPSAPDQVWVSDITYISTHEHEGWLHLALTKKAGLDKYRGFWTGAAQGDYDHDGNVYLCICGYVKYQSDVNEPSRQYSTLLPFSPLV